MAAKSVSDCTLAIQFTEEDLNTYEQLTLQFEALECAISNAADVEESTSLESLRMFAAMIQASFTVFLEDLQIRMENATPTNKPALSVVSRIRPEPNH